MPAPLLWILGVKAIFMAGFIIGWAWRSLVSQKKQWHELLECTETLLQLAESAPVETWRNDVQDNTGTLDEGQVLTGQLFDRTARAIRAVGGYAGE